MTWRTALQGPFWRFWRLSMLWVSLIISWEHDLLNISTGSEEKKRWDFQRFWAPTRAVTFTLKKAFTTRDQTVMEVFKFSSRLPSLVFSWLEKGNQLVDKFKKKSNRIVKVPNVEFFTFKIEAKTPRSVSSWGIYCIKGKIIVVINTTSEVFTGNQDISFPLSQLFLDFFWGSILSFSDVRSKNSRVK